MTGMHKSDALPPSVQQIMDAITGCEASSAELRELITTALADAEREGAEAMREAAAAACEETYTIPVLHGDVIIEAERPCYPAGMTACNIRALPLPTGSQPAGAVLLTDEQIERGRKQVFSTDNPFCPCDAKTMRKAARWAEAAVFAANGLEVRRG